MYRSFLLFLFLSILNSSVFCQSLSFTTYTNPVIPGDHPDCTVTQIGNDYYTTGSSFNVTPVIYHSTDLVHWEAIAQPVSASWAQYGDSPAGGCWGGQMVYHGGKYWDFFGVGYVMYFVTADKPEGPWSTPTLMRVPQEVPGLGADNSIFIDDDGSWYLLVKNGQPNNWIVQLGEDGHAAKDDGHSAGAVYNLTWINPAPSFPYSWAEGPVMWKHNGYYYYSFARDVSGGQKVMRSKTLTDDQSAWTMLGNLFNESDPLKAQSWFQNPNHSSAAVMLADSTSWVVHPVWSRGVSNEWGGQGRQGLLNQVRYDSTDKPIVDYPINAPFTAPKLPSSGIPWMVPHADFFDTDKLNPEWSFLGYTPATSYSLTKRSGWLTLSPKGSKPNTIIKNDGEHNYTLITRLDFSAKSVNDQAGIWIFNGNQDLHAKLYASMDSSANKIVAFSYKTYYYEVKNPNFEDNTVMLKLVRVNHKLSGFFSIDGKVWTSVGSSISVADMDIEQPNWNSWTGNRQGLYVQGSSADFDYYIYRDAYTPILAECPANQFGTKRSTQKNFTVLDNIHNNDWALYAGVEFGNTGYPRNCDSLKFYASCATTGGNIEVWLDSIDTGKKIAECSITNTGSYANYQTFTTKVLSPVTGTHDLYLKFTGTETNKFFLLQYLYFVDNSAPLTSVDKSYSANAPVSYSLEQNYPNPFNPTTRIKYSVGKDGPVKLTVYDILGKNILELVNEYKSAGNYTVEFNAKQLSSGMYFYKLEAGSFNSVKKMILIK